MRAEKCVCLCVCVVPSHTTACAYLPYICVWIYNALWVKAPYAHIIHMHIRMHVILVFCVYCSIYYTNVWRKHIIIGVLMCLCYLVLFNIFLFHTPNRLFWAALICMCAFIQRHTHIICIYSTKSGNDTSLHKQHIHRIRAVCLTHPPRIFSIMEKYRLFSFHPFTLLCGDAGGPLSGVCLYVL